MNHSVQPTHRPPQREFYAGGPMPREGAYVIRNRPEIDAILRVMGGASVMRSNVKRQPGNNLGTYRQSFYFPSLIDS